MQTLFYTEMKKKPITVLWANSISTYWKQEKPFAHVENR